MSSNALKQKLYEAQDGVCDISGVDLPPEMPLFDKDRLLPKAEGGTYTVENTRVVDPIAHMKRHGIWRERTEALDILKSMFDDRVQVMKLIGKENNQLQAYGRRVDHKSIETENFLREHLKPVEARLEVIDRQIAKVLKTYPDPLVQAALKVKGLGPITVAALTVYVDFTKQVCNRCHHGVRPDDVDPKEKTTAIWCKCAGEITLTEAASTASSLWKYVGIHTSSHERYTKGEAGGGNKTLRTAMWNSANSMVKTRNAYRDVYDRVKARLAVSEKIVQSRNTHGKLVEVAWKDAKAGHRHGAALRAVMKHILADYWFVGRTLAGMSTRAPYAKAMLGHKHMIAPEDRGWVYR